MSLNLAGFSHALERSRVDVVKHDVRILERLALEDVAEHVEADCALPAPIRTMREDMKLRPDFHVVFAADVARQTDAQDVAHVTGCQHGLDLGLGRVIQCGMFVLHALQ